MSDKNFDKPTVFKYKDIDFHNISVSELNKEGQQPLAYIRYNMPGEKNGKYLLVQTDNIVLTHHGIPQLDPPDAKHKYYEDDSKREFIKIPLDLSQPSCVELKKHLEKADEWAGSKEFRDKLFGKRSKEYTYQSCIRAPANNNQDEDGEKKTNEIKKVSCEYVKFKFNMEINGKERINKTKITRLDNSGNNIIKTLVEAKTITEIHNLIKYKSTVRVIFYYSKIWANKSTLPGAQFKTYGIGFKVMTIEYIPSTNNNRLTADYIQFNSDNEYESNENKKNKINKIDDDENKKIDEEKNKKNKIKKFDDDDHNENKKTKDKKLDDHENKKNKNKNNEEEVKKNKNDNDHENKEKNKKKHKKIDTSEDEMNEEEEEEEEIKVSNKNIKSHKK